MFCKKSSLGATSNLNLALTGMSADADVQVFQDINNNGVIDVCIDTFVGSSILGGNHDDMGMTEGPLKKDFS